MPQSKEISIDLTAQELQELPAPDELMEVEDICAIDSLQLPQQAANTDPAPVVPGDGQTMEIELTPMEMDAMLDGTWKP